MTNEAFPLSWPFGRKRTNYRQASRFKTTFAVARDELFAELKRIGASAVILSTNVNLRRDGLPYAGQRNPDDPGVAVYFTRKGRQLCFCCDRWRKVEDNIWAVVKTIEAIRGIERWGTGDAVEAAFTGFEALPAPAQDEDWWVVLGVSSFTATNEVEEAYVRLARKHHPDRNPGDQNATAMMQKLNAAYGKFKKERGL